LLDFQPQYSDLKTIIRDAWNFHRKVWGLVEAEAS